MALKIAIRLLKTHKIKSKKYLFKKMSIQLYFCGIDKSEHFDQVTLKTLTRNRKCQHNHESVENCVFSCCELSFGRYHLGTADDVTAQICLEGRRMLVEGSIDYPETQNNGQDSNWATFGLNLYKIPHDLTSESSCLIGFHIGEIENAGELIDDVALRLKLCVASRDVMQNILTKVYLEFGIPLPPCFGVVGIASQCQCCK